MTFLKTYFMVASKVWNGSLKTWAGWLSGRARKFPLSFIPGKPNRGVEKGYFNGNDEVVGSTPTPAPNILKLMALTMVTSMGE